MGLDITAYSKIEFIGTMTTEEWERKHDWHSTVHVWPGYVTGDGFAEWADGLVADGVYQVNGKTHGFRAGSYSWYNIWREWLSQSALGVNPKTVWDDFPAFEGKPFARLIYFSDCEGLIAGRYAKELALDFQEWNERLHHEEKWYLDRYENWKRAFGLAANDGLVEFH